MLVFAMVNEKERGEADQACGRRSRQPISEHNVGDPRPSASRASAWA